MKMLIISGILLTIIAFNLSSTNAEEICLKNAWAEFNNKNYLKAIEFADQCIDDFGRIALKKQLDLENKKVPLPPTGKVSDADKNAIFEKGLLNDVATAYWIKARSYEYLYKAGGKKKAFYKRKAAAAYNETIKYSYGRTWDPQGWFWSPCESAKERLPID